MNTSSNALERDFDLWDSLVARPVDILAVGSAVLEQVIRIPRFPQQGKQESIPVTRMSWSAGGGAVNVSCFAARTGVRAAPVICIGIGRYGQPILEELGRSHVDTSFVRVRAGHEGSMILLLTDEEGSWTALDAIDPTLILRADDIPALEVFESAKIVHIDGFAFTTAGDERAMETVVERARAAGCLLSVDGAVPAAQLKPTFLTWLFRRANVVFANEFESLSVTGQKTLHDAARAFQAWGPRLIVIKRGASGSLLITPEEIAEIPAFDVQVVDTVAAGDAYAAITLASLCRGLNVQEATLWASAAGALACTGPGSLGANFGMPEIEAQVARAKRESREL